MNIEMKIATKMPRNISYGNYTEMDSGGLKVTIKVHHFGRQPRARRYEILANTKPWSFIILKGHGVWVSVQILEELGHVGQLKNQNSQDMKNTSIQYGHVV